jgi:hypothetical protein
MSTLSLGGLLAVRIYQQCEQLGSRGKCEGRGAYR